MTKAVSQFRMLPLPTTKTPTQTGSHRKDHITLLVHLRSAERGYRAWLIWRLHNTVTREHSFLGCPHRAVHHVHFVPRLARLAVTRWGHRLPVQQGRGSLLLPCHASPSILPVWASFPGQVPTPVLKTVPRSPWDHVKQVPLPQPRAGAGEGSRKPGDLEERQNREGTDVGGQPGTPQLCALAMHFKLLSQALELIKGLTNSEPASRKEHRPRLCGGLKQHGVNLTQN